MSRDWTQEEFKGKDEKMTEHWSAAGIMREKARQVLKQIGEIK